MLFCRGPVWPSTTCSINKGWGIMGSHPLVRARIRTPCTKSLLPRCSIVLPMYIPDESSSHMDISIISLSAARTAWFKLAREQMRRKVVCDVLNLQGPTLWCHASWHTHVLIRLSTLWVCGGVDTSRDFLDSKVRDIETTILSADAGLLLSHPRSLQV